MAKYVQSFKDFITEAAAWDDANKRLIDKYFVSFDEKEKYELRDFIASVIKRINKKDLDRDELLKVIMSCKNKVAHNHPRNALLKCVLAHYDIEITD